MIALFDMTNEDRKPQQIWSLERLLHAIDWWRSSEGFGHFNEELYKRIQRVKFESEKELQTINTKNNERRNN